MENLMPSSDQTISLQGLIALCPAELQLTEYDYSNHLSMNLQPTAGLQLMRATQHVKNTPVSGQDRRLVALNYAVGLAKSTWTP